MSTPFKRPSTPEELLAYIDQAMASIGGCSDGGCVIQPPVGMHTNGGCRCYRDQKKMMPFAARMRYAYLLLREIVQNSAKP